MSGSVVAVLLLAAGSPGSQAALHPSSLLGVTATATAASPNDLVDHTVRLNSLNERLGNIATRIGDAEKRVAVLKDTALSGAVARTKAIIVHKNQMGSGFVLEQAIYSLDGGVLLSKDNADGSLDGQKEIRLYDGALAAGAHQLEVTLVFRGGSFGLFTYLEAYKFKVSSRYKLEVTEGRTNQLTIVAHEKPDITSETAERIAIRYDLEISPGPALSAPGN